MLHKDINLPHFLFYFYILVKLSWDTYTYNTYILSVVLGCTLRHMCEWLQLTYVLCNEAQGWFCTCISVPNQLQSSIDVSTDGIGIKDRPQMGMYINKLQYTILLITFQKILGIVTGKCVCKMWCHFMSHKISWFGSPKVYHH